MSFKIVRNDITKMHVDAIVNAAKSSLLGGSGVDGCIHRAAGPELLKECRTLGGCETGKAKLTKAYRLPCQYVIHTVGPVWDGGTYGERDQLISCYRTSLALAKEYGCESIAFPLISSGAYGYPKDQALRVAIDTISEFLQEHEMTIYLVVYDKASYEISSELFDDIREYIDEHYVEEHFDLRSARLRRQRCREEENRCFSASDEEFDIAFSREPMALHIAQGIDDLIFELDAGFSETLLKLIDRSGKTDPEIYKKANVDRKLFSKIKNNPAYKPAKTTAIALAIALELNLTETKDLIGRAGYALSHSDMGDVIIEYFIKHRNYNIFEINEVLFKFDQRLLGV